MLIRAYSTPVRRTISIRGSDVVLTLKPASGVLVLGSRTATRWRTPSPRSPLSLSTTKRRSIGPPPDERRRIHRIHPRSQVRLSRHLRVVYTHMVYAEPPKLTS